jgi:transcriptional regulator with XRE-family HTH domain
VGTLVPTGALVKRLMVKNRIFVIGCALMYSHRGVAHVAKSRNKPDPVFIESFKLRLAALAKILGSGNALADAIDSSRAGVRKWLGGESFPTVPDVKRLCAAAGTRVQWLVNGDEPQQVQGAKFVTEDGVRFYSEAFIHEVALALNREIKHRNGVITADQHAKVLQSLLYLFKSNPTIESKAIEMILDSHM